MIIDGISYGLSAEALAERKGRVFNVSGVRNHRAEFGPGGALCTGPRCEDVGGVGDGKMGERVMWQPIETAPRDRYFLAVALPERSEEKLAAAIFGDDARAPDRHLIVARIRPKQRKGRVFASVTGQPFWASHWTDLPEMPQ